jgi:Mg2+ and Co2+ transporter CorA
MTTFNSYIDQPISDLHKKYNAFWAFSKSQFEEKKEPGVKYARIFMNLFCNSETAKDFLKEFNQIHADATERYLAENSREDIIRYELANHECYYTHDISDAVEAVESYGITEEEVLAVFHAELQKIDY